MAKINLTPPTLSAKHLKRFHERVDKTPGQGPNGDCWEWTDRKFPNGYGILFVGRDCAAHRLAYFIATGVWSEVFVCHACDNPPCCNDAHLFEGSCLDNNRDAKAKGRNAVGDRNGARKHRDRMPRGDDHPLRRMPERAARGERNGTAKLTESLVLAIRREADSGLYRQKDIGLRYGVCQMTVSLIRQRKIWSHVADVGTVNTPDETAGEQGNE